MAQTKAGAAKARATIIKYHGADYYVRIGQLGGSAPTALKNAEGKNLKGFALNREVAVRAGRLGGTISKRGRK